MNEDKTNITNEERTKLLKELRIKIDNLRKKKKTFKDRSRLFCCSCFSTGIIIMLIVFYIFDVVKHDVSCKESKKIYMEICDAPTISFWPRFLYIFIAVTLLIFGLYCTGPTIVVFDPDNNKVIIDKKKMLCLPSIYEYDLEDLQQAYIESDISDGMPNLSNFYFYSVILIFNNEHVNLGLGRDCFLLNDKIELVKDINNYLDAIKTKV
jgi:hypothetical protein